MPLIIDDGLDDLFGEGPTLELSSPPSKDLLRHVDETCAGGCNQKLDWSKAGCIARIGFDKRSVILQHLFCAPEDGQWKLSKEYPIEDVFKGHGEGQLVHLSWDTTASHLAVIDVFGRISLFAVYFSMNRMNMLRRGLSDPADSLAGVVGMMWLYVDKPAFFNRPAVKTNGQWNFSCSQQKLTGPRNPHQKPAFVTITRAGTIRVLYHDKEARVQEFKAELDHIKSRNGLLTHAAMCADKGAHKDSLLLAAYSIEKQLRLYRVNLDFERSSISLQHLKLVSNCSPLSSNDEVLAAVQDGALAHAQLSLLDIIPAGPESRSRGSTQPFILGAFSYRSNDFRSSGTPHTVLCKWEMQLGKPTLHSSFGQLSSKKPNTSSTSELPAEYILKRLPDFAVPKTLLSINHVNLSVVLGMLYSDGSIEFRDSTTMQLLPTDPENQISSLSQVGFAFPEGRSCLQVALSPNSCSVFSLDEHHNPIISMMQVSNQDGNVYPDESFFEIVNEAFVTQVSCTTMTTPSYTDDLLATMQVFANQYFVGDNQGGFAPALANSMTFDWRFMCEIYRILGINPDHAMDEKPDQGFKNPFHQRCLGIQAALSFPGHRARRSIGANIAWAMLNTRNISMAFALSSTRRIPMGDTELKNPEIVTYLLGLVSWATALNASIIDEIFTLANGLEDLENGQNSVISFVNEHIQTTSSHLLPLLLISTSRAILRYNCRYIRVLAAESDKHRDNLTPLGLAYREFDLIIQSAPVSIIQVERILTQVDVSIKHRYQVSGISDADRLIAERDMLIRAEIPEVLNDVLKNLLLTRAQELREEVNAAELFFMDVGWLGLNGDRSSMERNRKHPIDVIQKIRLREGKDVRVRRCTRCGAVMEDLKRVSYLVAGLARSCVCGSAWMLLDTDEVERAE